MATVVFVVVELDECLGFGDVEFSVGGVFVLSECAVEELVVVVGAEAYGVPVVECGVFVLVAAVAGAFGGHAWYFSGRWVAGIDARQWWLSFAVRSLRSR